MVGEALPPSLAAEGSAIRRAIVADFAAVAGVRVIEPVDARCLGPERPPANVTRIIVDPAHPIDLGSLAMGAGRSLNLGRLVSGCHGSVLRPVNPVGRSLGARGRSTEPVAPNFAPMYADNRIRPQLGTNCDGVILIAPETDGILLGLAEELDRAGLWSLGSTPEAIALCSDKLALAGHFERLGVPTPLTLALEPGVDWPEFPSGSGPNRVPFESLSVSLPGWQGSPVPRNPGPEPNVSNLSGVPGYRRPLPPGDSSGFRGQPDFVVVKPTDGAGAVETFVLPGSAPRPVWLRNRDGMIVQPLRPGEALSASFLVGRDGRAHLIAVGRQVVAVEPDGQVNYRGGLLPIPLIENDLAPVCRAVESVPGLLGFVGVDFLRDELSGAVEVIEINPRLTTSIVGLVRLAPPGTVARAWLALASGTNAFDDGADFRAIRAAAPVRFRADGSPDLDTMDGRMTTPPSPRWLAFDIGGANLKAAHSGGKAVSRPFELWKRPDDLAEALGEVAGLLPESDAWAITMTAELCDCFATKADGVRSILAATVQAAGDRTVRVFGTDGQFHAVESILQTPRLAAASNWLALATVVARAGWGDSGLLIDIGSTTTDLIPWRAGEVAIPLDQRTDHGRLRSGALVYAGVRRTPLCTFGPTLPYRGEPIALMAELFATTADVYLTLGDLPPDTFDRSTADGGPLTYPASLDRLARMVGLDRDDFTADDAQALAESAAAILLDRLADTAQRLTFETLGAAPPVVVVAGAGEFLAQRLAARVVAPGGSVRSLTDAWGLEASHAACAHALLELVEAHPS